MKNHNYDNSENNNSSFKVIAPKILSVVAAVILWFYVVDMQTTVEEKVISGVPVVLENFDNSEGLSILSGMEHTIEVTVSGLKNVLSDVSQNNIRASADLNGIDEAGTYKLDINIATPKGISVVNKSASVVSVLLDRTTTVYKKVDVDLHYLTESAYEVGEPIISDTSIQVEGPEKIVDSVDKLSATLELGWLNDTFKSECSIVPVDKYGKPVVSPYLNISKSAVSVRVPVYKTETFVVKPVFVDENYEYKYKVTPSSVIVRGEVSNVDAIQEVFTSEIDLTKPGHVVKPLSLPNYLSAYDSDGTQIYSVNIDISSVKKIESTEDDNNINESETDIAVLNVIAEDEANVVE